LKENSKYNQKQKKMCKFGTLVQSSETQQVTPHTATMNITESCNKLGSYHHEFDKGTSN